VTSSYLSGNKHSYDILELLINNSFTPFHILDELLKCCYDRDLFNDLQLKLWKSLVEKLKSRGAKTNIEEPKEFTLIRQNNKIKNLMKLSALVGILFPCSFALILAMKKKMECLKKSQNSTKIFD
jgi:hypothetical protein